MVMMACNNQTGRRRGKDESHITPIIPVDSRQRLVLMLFFLTFYRFPWEQMLYSVIELLLTSIVLSDLPLI